ncbi:MAG: hypothetical protein IPL53_16535 [Ignavibacteria bacterium]|nr:hypothetical protein [Ignavibacteria bacterium]
MDDKKPNSMSYDQWMTQAKEYACRHFEYNLKDDHEFWDVLKEHWSQNKTPNEAVQDAIIEYGNKE